MIDSILLILLPAFLIAGSFFSKVIFFNANNINLKEIFKQVKHTPTLFLMPLLFTRKLFINFNLPSATKNIYYLYWCEIIGIITGTLSLFLMLLLPAFSPIYLTIYLIFSIPVFLSVAVKEIVWLKLPKLEIIFFFFLTIILNITAILFSYKRVGSSFGGFGDMENLLTGGVIFIFLLLFIKVFKNITIDFFDVILIVSIAIFFGFRYFFLSLTIALLLATAFAFFSLILKKIKSNDLIPLSPFFLISTLITLIFLSQYYY